LNVIKDQDMLAMLNDANIQKFIQNQDFTKLLQEPGILEMLQDQKNVEALSQILKDSQLEGFLKMHEAQKPNTDLIIGMGVLGIVSLLITIASLVAKQIINKSKIDKLNEYLEKNKHLPQDEIKSLNDKIGNLEGQNTEYTKNIKELKSQVVINNFENTSVNDDTKSLKNNQKELFTSIKSLEEKIEALNKKVKDNEENKELLDNLSNRIKHLKGRLENTIDGQWRFAGQVRDTFMTDSFNPVDKIKQIKSIESILSLVELFYSSKELKKNVIRVTLSESNTFVSSSKNEEDFYYTLKEEDKDLKTLLTNLTNEFVTKCIESELKKDMSLDKKDIDTIKNKVSEKIKKDYDHIQLELEEDFFDYMTSYINDIVYDIETLNEIKEKIDPEKKNSKLKLDDISLVPKVDRNQEKID